MYFTKTEKEIVLLVQKGYTNTQIGDKMGYSSEYIKKLLRKIYRILGVRRRVELVSLVVRYSK